MIESNKTLDSMEEFVAKKDVILKRDLLKFRLAMGCEDLSKI
jgi:hypothetical protein